MDIQDLRDRTMAGKYVVSDHAREEARHEGFRSHDFAACAACIFSGQIVDQDWDFESGVDFLVEGRTSGSQTARVKVGVLDDDRVVFITIYSVRRRRTR